MSDEMSDYKLDKHLSGGPMLHQTTQQLKAYLDSKQSFLDKINDMLEDPDVKEWCIYAVEKGSKEAEDELARREEKKKADKTIKIHILKKKL